MGKVLILILLLFTTKVQAQTIEKSPDNWQNLDLKTDGVFGISTEKMYNELLKDKTPHQVLVAVIDGGVDIQHEDLKSVIWTNPKDGTHGMNFYSTMTKGDEEFDRAELVRSLKKYKNRFEEKDSTNISPKELPAFREYKNLKQALTLSIQPIKNRLKSVQTKKETLKSMIQKMVKINPSIEDFKNYTPSNAQEAEMQMDIIQGLKIYEKYVPYKMINLERAINHYEMQLAYDTLQDYDLRTGGPTAYHGTHIAGIIAANRINNLGIKGIANNVKIMVIRAIRGINPEGEGMTEPGILQMVGSEGTEQDKSIAKSIHFAVDNGAKVINISFGQFDNNTSKVLIEAFKYARAKDLLIVHASGNKGLDLDRQSVFPDRKTSEGKYLAEGWIDVAASGWKNDTSLVSKFSNYGKTTVDVYAPGVEIVSTIPRSKYLADTGTSMAAPVVSGLAAVIWEYYPQLTAKQVKEIITKSIMKANILKDKCISGGIINAYEALKFVKSIQK